MASFRVVRVTVPRERSAACDNPFTKPTAHDDMQAAWRKQLQACRSDPRNSPKNLAALAAALGSSEAVRQKHVCKIGCAHELAAIFDGLPAAPPVQRPVLCSHNSYQCPQVAAVPSGATAPPEGVATVRELCLDELVEFPGHGKYAKRPIRIEYHEGGQVRRVEVVVLRGNSGNMDKMARPGSYRSCYGSMADSRLFFVFDGQRPTMDFGGVMLEFVLHASPSSLAHKFTGGFAAVTGMVGLTSPDPGKVRGVGGDDRNPRCVHSALAVHVDPEAPSACLKKTRVLVRRKGPPRTDVALVVNGQTIIDGSGAVGDAISRPLELPSPDPTASPSVEIETRDHTDRKPMLVDAPVPLTTDDPTWNEFGPSDAKLFAPDEPSYGAGDDPDLQRPSFLGLLPPATSGCESMDEDQSFSRPNSASPGSLVDAAPPSWAPSSFLKDALPPMVSPTTPVALPPLRGTMHGWSPAQRALPQAATAAAVFATAPQPQPSSTPVAGYGPVRGGPPEFAVAAARHQPYPDLPWNGQYRPPYETLWLMYVQMRKELMILQGSQQ